MESTELVARPPLGMPSQEPEGDSVYVLPCSESQRVCWYLEQLTPRTPVNNIAVRFRLSGPLNPAILEQAFAQVTSRHEILRTNFEFRSGTPKQVVHAAGGFQLPLIDFTRLAEPSLSQQTEQVAAEEARIGFDLQAERLLRGQLLQTAPDQHVLLVTIHHIVADGWSVGVLADELGAHYEALLEGKEPDVPALPLQYADYACWQENWLSSEELSGQLKELKAELDGFTPLRLNPDFERSLAGSNKGEIRSLLLDRHLTDTLKTLSDQQGCTLFVTMLSAFNMLMFSESGQTDLVIRTQTAGRNSVELEPLIGWFVNSIVFRNQLNGSARFLDFVKDVNGSVVRSLERQAIPFERLLETVKPQFTGDRQPPFQVNFIFQRDFVKPWSRCGVDFVPIPSKSAGTFVDLNFFLVERKDGWRLSVDVNTDLFRPETGERLIERLRSILAEIARSSGDAIAEILQRSCPAPITRQAGYLPAATRQRAQSPSASAQADHIEQKLIAIWRDLLGSEGIDRDTNFFDAGGHSLLAVQMLTRVQAAYDSKMQLAELFREPTIAAMARALARTSTSKESDAIIPIQPKGANPPFFMVGGDHWFRPLAQHIGQSQPFLGVGFLQDGSYPIHFEFADLAASISRRICGEQPAGPYVLGGWCVDGALAFEAARLLELQGATVALVVLFDVINPAYRRKYRGKREALGRGIHRTLAFGKQLRRTGEYRGAWTELKNLTEKAVLKLKKPPTSTVQHDLEHADVDRQQFRRLLYEAEERYTPRQIAAPIALFRTKVDEFQSQDLGWAGLSRSGLQVIELAADHTSMFYESEVAPLAAAMKELLAEARPFAAPAA